MVLDNEVRPLTLATGDHTFALTAAAVQAGDQRLVWQDRAYIHGAFHTFLQRWIYRDQTLTDLLMPAIQSGTPMTYMLGGKQYIVVAVSGGAYSGEYIAYSLPN